MIYTLVYYIANYKVRFGPIWYLNPKTGPIGYGWGFLLLKKGPIWSVLVRFGPIWSDLARFWFHRYPCCS